MKSTKDLELKCLEELKNMYYKNGHEAGYDLGWSNSRIASIARLIKNTGQEIYARKFMDASELEMKFALDLLAKEEAERKAKEQELEKAKEAKSGKKSRDWQWV